MVGYESKYREKGLGEGPMKVIGDPVTSMTLQWLFS